MFLSSAYLLFVLFIMSVFCSCVSRYSLGVSQEEMKQELHDYLPSLEHWAKEYLSSTTPKAISLKMYVRTLTPIVEFFFSTLALQEST